MSLPGPDAQLHEGAWDAPMFNLPNLRVRSYRTEALAPVSSWRAVGAGPNVFVYETLLDEVIHAAGADPLEERIRLMGHDVSVKVLEAVGEMCSWNGAKLGEGRGRGVAYGFSFGVPVGNGGRGQHDRCGHQAGPCLARRRCGAGHRPDATWKTSGRGARSLASATRSTARSPMPTVWRSRPTITRMRRMRLYQCPPIEFRALENNPAKIRGFGEPPIPPSAPALGNAIFAATGQRIREMPFNKHIDFV